MADEVFHPRVKGYFKGILALLVTCLSVSLYGSWYLFTSGSVEAGIMSVALFCALALLTSRMHLKRIDLKEECMRFVPWLGSSWAVYYDEIESYGLVGKDRLVGPSGLVVKFSDGSTFSLKRLRNGTELARRLRHRVGAPSLDREDLHEGGEESGLIGRVSLRSIEWLMWLPLVGFLPLILTYWFSASWLREASLLVLPAILIHFLGRILHNMKTNRTYRHGYQKEESPFMYWAILIAHVFLVVIGCVASLVVLVS